MRDMVRTETEEMLDLSARTLSTLHARSAPRTTAVKQQEPSEVEQPETESLLGMAKRLTQRSRKKPPESGGDTKAWEMRTLLAAVETSEARELKPASAAALGALEVGARRSRGRS